MSSLVSVAEYEKGVIQTKHCKSVVLTLCLPKTLVYYFSVKHKENEKTFRSENTLKQKSIL